MKQKEIFQIFYEKASKIPNDINMDNELGTIISNLATETNKEFLKITDILLDNRVVPNDIDFALVGKLQAKIYQIRKDYRKNSSKLMAISVNSKQKTPSPLEVYDTINKDRQNSKYFYELLLQALFLNMELSLSLEIIANKNNVSADEIYKKGINYLIKYATRVERNNYFVKIEHLQNQKSFHYDEYQANTVVYSVLQTMDKSEKKDITEEVFKTIAKYLESKDIKTLNRAKIRLNIILENRLHDIKDIETKKSKFHAKDVVIKLFDDVIIAKKEKQKASAHNVTNKQALNQQVTTKQAIAIIESFLNFNGTIRDFSKSAIYPYSQQYGKNITDKLYALCRFKPELKPKLEKHLQELKDYELSYADTLLDIILHYLKNGVPTFNGEVREFDIIDYYTITNFSLDDFRTYVAKNKMLNVEESKLFSRFMKRCKIIDSLKDYNMSLERFLNSYNVNLKINGKSHDLTNDEKMGIYAFLLNHNIPVCSLTVNIAIRRYASGTLFISHYNANELSKKLVKAN